MVHVTKMTKIPSILANMNYFYLLFITSHIAHGSYQARGQIGVAAVGLHYSHSNAGS